MARTIQIELPSTGPVGTRATVTTTRWLRSPLVDVYLCHKAGAIMGGEWINAETGREANYQTACELNEAAQAAARLAGNA